MLVGSNVSIFVFFFVLALAACVFCFFFFQAEDGIRDGHVTGVQTCALPISRACIARSWSRARERSGALRGSPTRRLANKRGSGERRVGKECRSRWSPYH